MKPNKTNKLSQSGKSQPTNIKYDQENGSGPTFLEKYQTWIKCLADDDPNSINNQIVAMVWDQAVWKMIYETRKYSPLRKDGSRIQNRYLNQFMDRCFFQKQLVAIRRQIDSFPLEGEKGVYCLKSLLEDLKENCHLLTRQNLLSAAKLEYDYEPIKRKAEDYATQKIHEGIRTGQNGGGFTYPSDLDWRSSADMHEDIDRLTGKTPTTRSPSDTIKIEIISYLKKRLDAFELENCKKIVHKYLAHSATPESRETVKDIDISIDQFQEAIRKICEVARFLNAYIVRSVHIDFMLKEQSSVLENLDIPLLAKENFYDVGAIWQQFKKDVDEWKIDWNQISAE